MKSQNPNSKSICRCGQNLKVPILFLSFNPIRLGGQNPKSKIQNPKLKIPFTLIELVVVMGIMAMLIGIALPAFTKLAKGSGASLASRTLVGKLGLTRGYAINARQYAALLFYQADEPTTLATPEGDSYGTKYLNKSYRTCYVAKESTTGNFYFQRWVQGENWDYTPAGVAVLEVNDLSAVNLSGGLLSPDNSSGNFTKIYYNSTAASGSSAILYVPGIIFAPTGKPVPVGDRFVKIGEGTYSSGAAVTVTNRVSTAYVPIKVDQYTGRITFGAE